MNTKVEELLQDFEMVNPALSGIIRQVRGMVSTIASDCRRLEIPCRVVF